MSAVMDAAALSLANAGDARSAIKANKARAAVAELRAAATSARAQLRDVTSLLGMAGFSDAAMHCEAISDHLEAALARVQGGQS